MGSATALALWNTWRNSNKKECREKAWSTASFADLGHTTTVIGLLQNNFATRIHPH